MEEIRNSKFDIGSKTVNGFVAIALQLNSLVQEMDLDVAIELEEIEYNNILKELDDLELLEDDTQLNINDEDYLIYKLEKDCHVTNSIPANEHTKKFYFEEMIRIENAVR